MNLLRSGHSCAIRDRVKAFPALICMATGCLAQATQSEGREFKALGSARLEATAGRIAVHFMGREYPIDLSRLPMAGFANSMAPNTTARMLCESTSGAFAAVWDSNSFRRLAPPNTLIENSEFCPERRARPNMAD